MAILTYFLIILGVGAAAVAAYVVVTEQSRRQVVERSLGRPAESDLRRQIRRDERSHDSAFQRNLRRAAPDRWTKDVKTKEKLVQAGHDDPSAPLYYSFARVVSTVALPLLVFLFGPRNSFFQLLMSMIGAAVIGFVAPIYYLVRAVRVRQDKIRKSLPDTLDLLVVCVEAGISLDAAILRVAKELLPVHPELAGELMVVNQKNNAGMVREEALRGMWERTGVEELRTLIASLIQSEKWGSSSSRTLRVSSETLRRKRRQSAERRAATAPVKMIIPLALLIFPALFIVILGPAVLNIVAAFRGR
jgi:tight adherence protein C